MSSQRRSDLRAWANELVQHRQQAGLTQAELGARCGVSASAVGKWEDAESVPKQESTWPLLQQALPELSPPPPYAAVLQAQASAQHDRPVGSQPRVEVPLAEPAAPASQPEAMPAAAKPSYEDLEAKLRHLEEQAMTDALTGVANQRGSAAALERAVRAAHRRGEPLAVCMLDVDHFKRVNDTYGHPAGDQVLRAFAATIAGTLREGDTFGRWGGEEFLAVLEAVPPQRARVLAERLRARVAELNVEGLRVTVSIGIAVYTAPRRALRQDEVQQLAKQLVAHADQALYWAKQDGRDRVELWSSEASRARADRVVTAAVPLASPAKLSRLSLDRIKPAAASVGRVVAAVAILLGTASFGAEGRGCSGGGTTCGPGTCNDGGKCIPCGDGKDPTIDPAG